MDETGTTDGRRSGEVAALHRIATLIRAHGDLHDVVNDVLRAIAETVPCERPVVCLYEDDTDELRFHSPVHGDGELVPLGEPSILRRIFQMGRAETVDDVIADPDFNPVLAGMGDARQMAGAPLQVGGTRLGIVAAVNARRGTFTDGDLRILLVVAERAALAIEIARLRSALARQTQELTGLERLSRLLTVSETLEHVIGESLRIVTEMLGSERMAVLLFDEPSFALLAQPPTVGLTEQQTRRLAVPLSQPSLAGTVYRTGTPLLSNDADNDAWVDEPLRRLLGVRSVLVVPLGSLPRPTGVLLAINARKGFFDEGDMRFTTLLGGRIGSVIEASRGRERERALVHKLREADRTKTEFVSMLAHELSGPMTTILGFGQTLQTRWNELPEDKRSDILDILTREVARLSRLVNDLLDVSRMEAGTLRYELQPMDVGEMLEGMRAVHPSLEAAHIVDIAVEPGLPKVLGDHDRIRQVLLNLLTNATRYSPEGTTITVHAGVDGDGPDRVVKVTVADQGIGIAPDDAERVFSKFVMLPKPGWVKKGTGLGLFVTRSIVEAHGGRIWVDSEPGKGSTFSFTLRLADAG